MPKPAPRKAPLSPTHARGRDTEPGSTSELVAGAPVLTPNQPSAATSFQQQWQMAAGARRDEAEGNAILSDVYEQRNGLRSESAQWLARSSHHLIPNAQSSCRSQVAISRWKWDTNITTKPKSSPPACRHLQECFLLAYLFHQARGFSYSPLHGFVCTSIFLTRLAIPEFLPVVV